MEMKAWLSLKTLKKISGFGRWISKISYIYFIIAIKFIKSRINWINTIYSASIIFKAIYVCNLLYHMNGHPVYKTAYSERDMKFSTL